MNEPFEEKVLTEKFSKTTEEIPDERWYWIYFSVVITNSILLMLFWLFSRYFSG
jgi:hypothetical protein